MQHSCWGLISRSFQGTIYLVDAQASLWSRVRDNRHHGLQQQPIARKARSSRAELRASGINATQAGLGGPQSSSQAASPAEPTADLEVLTAGDAAPVKPRRRRNTEAPSDIFLSRTRYRRHKRADYAPGTRVGEDVQVLLARQLRDLMKNPIPGISIVPDENDMLKWHAVIVGPEGSLYAGGQFEVELWFTSNFPGEQPLIYFRTPICHPNIDELTGLTCVEMGESNNYYYSNLKLNGRHNVRSAPCVLIGLVMLLSNPNPESFVNREPDGEMTLSRDAFEKKAMERTRIYAIEKQASFSNALRDELFS